MRYIWVWRHKPRTPRKGSAKKLFGERCRGAGFGKSLSILRWLFQSIHALQEAVV
ncbi:MAG: hypothetical protein IRF16MM_02595 [Candidatus Midichloria mitochondrii]